MDASVLIFAIAAGAVAFVVIWLWQKWVTKRITHRLIAKEPAQTTMPDDRAKLKPESDFTVNVSTTEVMCSRPDGTTESVTWEDLQRVAILTTDAGPFAPDIFWVLYGSTDGCVIPWGATGEQELLAHLQALPGFQNDVVISAASLTTNHQLVCWERPQHNG